MSFSTWIQSAVSPKRTRSPTVGPNMATYASLEIFVSTDTSEAPGSGTCENPFLTKPATISSVLERSTLPVASPFPPEIILAPPISHSVTVLTSPGSKRTAVPAAMSSRLPYALPRSNVNAELVSMKW